MTWKELAEAIKKLPKEEQNKPVKIFTYGWSMYSSYFEPKEITEINTSDKLKRLSYGHEECIKKGVVKKGDAVLDLKYEAVCHSPNDLNPKFNPTGEENEERINSNFLSRLIGWLRKK